MEQQIRDYHARRILADIFPFDYKGKTYYITYPSAEFRFYAEKVYMEIYEKAKEENISLDNIIVLLDKYKMWSEEEENKLTKIKEEIENMKVSLFENFFKDDKRQAYKKVIADLSAEQNRLLTKKQSMDSFTLEYTAASAKQKFLVGASILKPNRKKLWINPSDWNKENDIIDVAFGHIIKNFLSEADIRDIVKNDPWRTIWSLNKRPQSMFRKNAGDFTDEQRSLCMWSTVYDNIRRSHNVPSDQIIEDDDALDGWMIVQKRKNQSEANKAEVSKMISGSKASKCEEVFVIASTDEQIKKIHDMNDFAGKIAFKKRMLQVQRDGLVNEVNMLDRREQIAMDAQNYFSSKRKG